MAQTLFELYQTLLRFIEEVTTDVDAVQERVLADILARHADAEYLATRCGLGGGGGATFRSKVPKVTYEDLKPYILRIANDVLDRCCLEMEEALSWMYRQSRVKDGSVGPLEIRVVRPGTFEELADHAVARGASIGQYKVPRCLTAPPDMELLDSRVVSNHSPALPHCAPAQRFQ